MLEYTARITSQDTPRVGGRNLFRKEYLRSNYISLAYSIPLEAINPREGDNTYILSFDYKISPEDKASSPRITCLYKDRKSIFWDSNVVRDGEWHHKEYTIQLDTDERRYPINGWFADYGSANGRTIDMVAVRNIKLERGTIATDWTPAPEDVAESVSTVNTSLVSLASTLLDPEQGEIHKLTDLLDKHSENFEDLATHPLTIDDKGYWQIWSVKDSKYLTTQYQSRGRDGQDAGRYLGRAKRIHRDFDGNYLLEPEGSSWQTAKEGDYVYLVGDLSNRGGDKDTYYIVREHKSKTVWEVYNIKGRSPVLTLDEQFRLVADGQLVSAVTLKGRDGQNGAKGEKGDKPVITLNDKYQLLADGELLSQQSLKGRDGVDGINGKDGQDGAKGADGKDGEKGADGHTPEIHVGTDYYIYVDGVKQRYIRGQKGEPGHSPTPEEVLGTSRFAELLGGEVTSKVTPLSKEIDKSSKYAVDLINETQTQLCDLQVLGMSDGGVIEVKRQAACCHYDYPERIIGTDSTPQTIPKPKYVRAQIPLTLRSSHDALSRQVSNLQTQLTSCTQRLTATKQELAKLKADTTITPILNADTRKRSTTLYPKYGDWLLTSDSQEQYISFSGLKAEIGRSIYIQTRKRAYLYANNHTFYGLPGTSSSVAVSQWLSNNTTYRFVRADATSWLVTASPSPYPWT